ncbi:aldehyde dehydrogenase [Polymorphobacter sp.]|uniref:aldehyde dehydrogenase n=1 Tax=Polymorphobacter sp. TaxID=1909290 RepID=UPI003F6E6438
MSDRSVPKTIPSRIAGQPREGDGARLPVIYPADETQVSELCEAGPEMVDAAVKAARQSFETGPWRRMSTDARGAVMRRVQQLITDHADELAWLECLNTGLPMARMRQTHMPRAAYNFGIFAEAASHVAGQVFTQDPRYLTTVIREPVGVAALMTPWNAPVPLTSMKIAAAIAFGNSCVVKPSELTPLAVSRMIELIELAGVPEGVVNLVNGRGQVTGQALVNHDDVDLISFTGGTATGRAIAAAAGQRLVPVTMELGGKSANIVFETADLDRALDGALLGIFSNNGQQCLAGSRILLHRSIADAFIERFVARVAALRIGDPMDPNTEIGPLVSAVHRDHVLSFAKDLGEDRLLAGGVSRPGKGFYIEPTAVLAASNASYRAQTEMFGPFATFLVFDTVDEAIAMANDSRYGLAAYVWTEHLPTALQCTRDIRAGVIWVNTPMMRELRAPFGGYKDSGIGREGTQDCLHFYTEPKTATYAVEDMPLVRMGMPT